MYVCIYVGKYKQGEGICALKLAVTTMGEETLVNPD